jgi:hypothetical protein
MVQLVTTYDPATTAPEQKIFLGSEKQTGTSVHRMNFIFILAPFCVPLCLVSQLLALALQLLESYYRARSSGAQREDQGNSRSRRRSGARLRYSLLLLSAVAPNRRSKRA